MSGKGWETTGRGINSQGNSYDNRSYPSGDGYHYSNANGSYYYSNPNGSTYYNSGDGYAQYKSPAGDSTKYYGDAANKGGK
ncbi:hypothetical protein NliqN6_2718 [Naganishia liquefaciens]|uniref:Uncharacterized protein n=1 Tax=Naganishia liquefaciens TaxID=104408 RepID=A0A8H3TSS3_9TREE|nr:hypothetical protein NliqN6_2718 [Naganishia liquefaciens]